MKCIFDLKYFKRRLIIMDKGIQFKVENDKFIMEIDFDNWISAQSFREDGGYNITNKDEMKQYIQKRIETGSIEDIYRHIGEEEIGLTMWMEVLDAIIDDAYESGEEWLDIVDLYEVD